MSHILSPLGRYVPWSVVCCVLSSQSLAALYLGVNFWDHHCVCSKSNIYTCASSVWGQWCIICLTCSHPELTKDHVLTSAYVKIFRIVTRNAVNKSFWRKKDCSWPPLNKYAMNIWLSSLRIRAHLSWRTGKHLHVLHVLRTYPTCSYPGYQDTTTYAALIAHVAGHRLPSLVLPELSSDFHPLSSPWDKFWIIV